MAIFQPSNVIPSNFAGIGGQTIDANNNVFISWQVNGNSPMTAFRIQIYNNKTNTQTVVKDTGVITPNNAPFYGVDNKGNPKQFIYEPSSTLWSSWGLSNGNEYKMVITQYWGENNANSVVQYSGSVFLAILTPTISINYVPNLTDGKGTVAKQGFTASITPSEITLNSVRWQFGEVEGDIKNLSNPIDKSLVDILEDTGDINTNVLFYEYAGLFTGKNYAINCTIITADGVEQTSGWQAFSVSYTDAEVSDSNNINTQCLSDDCVLLSWAKAVNIEGKLLPQGTQPIINNGILELSENQTITWDKKDDEQLNITTPYNLYWKTKTIDDTLSELYLDCQGNFNISPNKKWILSFYGTSPILYKIYPFGETQSIFEITTTTERVPISSAEFLDDEYFLYCDTNQGVKLYHIDSSNKTVTVVWSFNPKTPEEQTLYPYHFCVNKTQTQVAMFCRDNDKKYNYVVLYKMQKDENNVYQLYLINNNMVKQLPPEDGDRVPLFDGSFSTLGNYLILDCSYTQRDITLYEYKITSESIDLVTIFSITSQTITQCDFFFNPGRNNICFVDDNNFVTACKIAERGGLVLHCKVNDNGIYIERASTIDLIPNRIYLCTNNTTLILCGNSPTRNLRLACYGVVKNNSTTNIVYSGFKDINFEYSSFATPIQIVDNTLYVHNSRSPASIAITLNSITNTHSLKLNDMEICFDGIFYIVKNNGTTLYQGIYAWGSEFIIFNITQGKMQLLYLKDNKHIYSDAFVIDTEQSISLIELVGKQNCDWIYITKNDIKLNPDITPVWDKDTVFLADFLTPKDALQAGTFSESGNLLNALYRQTQNGKSLKQVVEMAAKYNKLKDYTIRSGQEYSWEMFYLDGSLAYSKPIKSKTICRQFKAYTLLEGKQDIENPNVYHVLNVWRFNNNLSVGAISNNNSPNWLTNFTPYRLRQPSLRLGQSGTLQALLSNYNQSENFYKDTVEMSDKLKQASVSQNTFFLKDMKGNLYMVGISAPITQTINTKSAVEEITISLQWEEVGDASNISLIQLPDDEGWEQDEVFEAEFIVDETTGMLSVVYPSDYSGTTFEIKDNNLYAQTPDILAEQVNLEILDGAVIASKEKQGQ